MEHDLFHLVVGVLVGMVATVALYWMRDRKKRRRHARLYRRSTSSASVPIVTADPKTSEYLDHVEAVCTQLMQDDQRLKAILNALSEGLALVDPKLRVAMCNPAFISMFRCKEGDPLPDASIQEESRHEFRRAVDGVLSSRRATTLEMRLTTIPPRDIFVALTPYGDDELASSIILTAFDVTQRKRVEAMRTEFVANVSHELRTPLAAIRGYVETCLEEAANGGEPPYDRFLPIVQQHALRLTALIEDLLILSRIESKGMQFKLQALQLNACVENAVTTLLPMAEKKRVGVVAALPANLPDVRADSSALERILLNLVENAVKYSEGDSTVRISARLEGDSICVMVTDQGVGIPREDQERIFERFYRVDKARSRKAGGTGLGLSIVKHLVQSLGGDVWVDSQVGRGSTFSFTIPLARQSEREVVPVGAR